MSYGRLEINLLPAELLPGPTVRYSLLLNVLLITVVVAYIVIDAYMGWLKLQSAQDERASLDAQKVAKIHILNDYNELVTLSEKIARHGRLIAMASTDYVDMPVLLDRIAHILPDGVYIESVTNQRTNVRGGPVNLSIALKSSRQDADLVVTTLRAFKQDELFSNCFMAGTNAEEESLKPLMEKQGLNWDASGPLVPSNIIADQYLIHISATLLRPLGGIDLPASYDETAQLASLDKPSVAPEITPTAQPAEESEQPAENTEEAS